MEAEFGAQRFAIALPITRNLDWTVRLGPWTTNTISLGPKCSYLRAGRRVVEAQMKLVGGGGAWIAKPKETQSGPKWKMPKNIPPEIPS